LGLEIVSINHLGINGVGLLDVGPLLGKLGVDNDVGVFVEVPSVEVTISVAVDCTAVTVAVMEAVWRGRFVRRPRWGLGIDWLSACSANNTRRGRQAVRERRDCIFAAERIRMSGPPLQRS
jgi:hypothetical protein